MCFLFLLFTISLLTENGATQKNGEEMIFGPKEVIEWLNDIEFKRLPTRVSKGEENNSQQFDCQKLDCCRFLQFTEVKVKHLQDDFFQFNYHNDSLHLIGQVENNSWNGIFTAFEKWFMSMNMTMIAYYDHNQLKGPVWRLLEENGYLISDNLEMNGDKVLYVYPGLYFGLFGRFSDGKMISAKPVVITGFEREEHGVMRPLWKFMEANSATYTYDPSSKTQLASNPLLRDPLEEYWVDIRESTIRGAGDGVFLKHDAPKNTIVAFFNGIRITLADTLIDEDMKHSVHKMWNDWTTDDMLYIPKEWINVDSYNASSGHKINHNSDFNVDAGYIDHPRFGKIRSIVTTQDLKAGQELFCQYANTIDSTTFVHQVFKDFSQYMDIKQDQDRTNFLENMQNNYEMMINSMKYDPNKHYWKP